jgi:tetratricopeptide (TPR) repeat protein
MTHRLIVEERSDGRVAVALRRSGQSFPEAAGDPVIFNSPFGAAEREDIRWYLEDYLIAPYAVYEERGRTIEAHLPEWGKALFESVFGTGKPGHDAYLKSREGQAELVIMSRSPAFLSLPWELLRDPKRATPLALDLAAIDRTLVIEGAAASVPPGETLRVLMVIARPSGLKDVGYQMIARPLVERLSAVRGRVRLDVLRPPTLEAMHDALDAATAAGEPYHIVHFDGHGTFGNGSDGVTAGSSHFDTATAARGYLAFEKDSGGEHLVSADEFALPVGQAKVPLVVLNACRSGMLGEGKLGEAAVEAAVATRLLEANAASVVAMGYSVYAVAAAEFMAEFYEALFAGRTVSDAVAAGRQRLYRRKDRPSPKGMLPLEDWIVPVHYLRSSISFSALKQNRRSAPLSLDAMLDRMRSSAHADSETSPAAEDKLAPVGRFVGRDAAFYTLELVLKWQRVVVVHGPAGAGKTELAKAFGRWWQATGGVEQPEWVFFHSFEPGVASFGLDGVVTQIGLQLFGPDFIGRTRDAAQRRELILNVLRERRMLLIWDNFETVRELPDVTGATPPLDAAQQQQMRDFLTELAREGGKTGVIITSRTPEDWLGEVRRHELTGLTSGEAAEMAEDVLRPYPQARGRRHDRAFGDLLNWLDGHPLSLRLLLPHLETISATTLLDGLNGNVANLPPGFVGEGRLASLGASLKYSFDHVAPEMRDRLPALALFEGVVDVAVLAIFSQVEEVPARFAGVAPEAWSTTLHRLAGIGLLTSLGGGMYGLHPALPFYLMAEWRRMAGERFEPEHSPAEGALLTAYSAFGGWLRKQIAEGSADTAFSLIERQQRTIGRLLGFALSQQRYREAQVLMAPLNEFWRARGLGLEAQGWGDRCRKALEAADGTLPDLDSAAGALWLFAVGAEANRAVLAGQLDTAYRTFDLIRQRLEASSAEPLDRRLGVVYHQLGVVADERGDLAAEGWYRKSLQITQMTGDRRGAAATHHQLGVVALKRGDLATAEHSNRQSLEIHEALGNRPAMAKSYQLLGRVMQDRGDLAAAEHWYRKSLEIDEALGDRPGITFVYHQLGIVAFLRRDFAAAENWYRKSLEIKEALGNRPGIALTYGELGLLAEARKDIATALDWTVRCIALFSEFPHPATGPGPKHLVRLTKALGVPALEASWQRCTSTPLPDHIRSAVVAAIDGQ